LVGVVPDNQLSSLTATGSPTTSDKNDTLIRVVLSNGLGGHEPRPQIFKIIFEGPQMALRGWKEREGKGRERMKEPPN